MQNAKHFKLTRRIFTQRHAKLSKICLRAKVLVYLDTERVVDVSVTVIY